MLKSTGNAGRVGGDYTKKAAVSAAADFILTNTVVPSSWVTTTVGQLIPTGAPEGSYFILVEDSGPVAQYAGVGVVNG